MISTFTSICVSSVHKLQMQDAYLINWSGALSFYDIEIKLKIIYQAKNVLIKYDYED